MHRVDGNDRMRVGGAGPHLGGNPDRFHDLLFGRALLQCECGVATDAIRALRYVRHRDRDELLRFRWQRAVGKDLLAERSESGLDFRGQLPSFLRQFFRSIWIHMLFHRKRSFPFDCVVYIQP